MTDFAGSGARLEPTKAERHERRSPPVRLATIAIGILSAFACHATTPDAGGTTPQDDLKKMTLEELMDIEVVSVSKRPERLFEAASAIQVVTGEDIRRSGATSLPEALRLADNLDVARKNAHDWAITSRGFNTELANKMLVLIDGRTVYTPLFSGVFWDRQSVTLEDIDKIEVISGPGGSLWGANAVNGVINITTKSAADTQGLYLSAGAGTQLRNTATVRYGGSLAPEVRFRVYGEAFNRGDEVLADGADASDASRMVQGGFRIDATPSPQDHFTLQGDAYNGKEDLVAGGKSNIGGSNVLGRWSRASSDDAGMSLQAYYDRTHLAVPIAALAFAPAGTLTDDLDTYDLDFQHYFRLGDRDRFMWGLGYRHTRDEVGNAPALTAIPRNLDQDLYSAFVQDRHDFTESLAVTLGSKIEHNDYTGFEVEPNLRLQWSFRHDQMLWGAVSRAVRIPSRIDRDFYQPAPEYALVILQGNPDFRSETVIAHELGYRAQFASSAALSVSAFYNVYDRVRSTTPGPPDPVFGLPFPIVFENNLEGETSGIELSADYGMRDWLRWHVGYRFLHENIRIKPGEVDFNDAHNEIADPRHYASLRASFDMGEDMELDAGLRWTGSREIDDGPSVETLPGYVELDVRFGWRLPGGLEISVVGQNLLHDRHAEYGFPGATQSEIERSLFGKVTWRH
jgi:iron complex outermembrane receptor protein